MGVHKQQLRPPPAQGWRHITVPLSACGRRSAGCGRRRIGAVRSRSAASDAAVLPAPAAVGVLQCAPATGQLAASPGPASPSEPALPVGVNSTGDELCSERVLARIERSLACQLCWAFVQAEACGSFSSHGVKDCPGAPGGRRRWQPGCSCPPGGGRPGCRCTAAAPAHR